MSGPSITRREILNLLAGSSALATAGRRFTPSPASIPSTFSELFGVRCPIAQAGMGGVAGPELAAAVSRAGGLGVIAGAHLPPDELRKRIHQLRGLTDQPFGVNLLLHPQVSPPLQVSSLPAGLVERVQHTLNRFRLKLGLPFSPEVTATRPDHVTGCIEVILQERVPVFSVGLGRPDPALVRRFHQRGAKVIAMASTVDDARELATAGVDAIIAQGHEAGGHRSTWKKRPTPEHAHIGTMALVPQVVRAVSPIPVLAAGGISDGRGLVAAFALGAVGVSFGTRFVATRESLALPFYKDALVRADSDSTTVTDAYTGLYARVLRNAFTMEYAASGAPVLEGYLQSVAARDIFAEAAKRQDATVYPMWAGQGVGMVNDLPGGGDIVERIMAEARVALEELKRIPLSV